MRKIFEPITIKNKTIKNRLVVSPMVSNFANEDGTPTDHFISYYEEKAKGGWGLIIIEDFPIRPTVGAYRQLPSLHTEELIKKYKAFTDRMHSYGAVVFAQLYHAGIKAVPHEGVSAQVPSLLPTVGPTKNAHAMSLEEIENLIEDFSNCAASAKRAGFDGVEIHGAHGYLLNQFASPLTNKRCDNYGGTLTNRNRLSCEIIKKVREKVGNDFIIDYRMTTAEYETGGLTIEESKAMAIQLEEAGIDMINVTQGSGKSWVVIPPSNVPKASFVNNAAEIKKVVDIPVIATGRINDPYLAEEVLKSGKADLCVMGRASIADPHMPEKAQAENYNDIIHCIGCNQGCLGKIRAGSSIHCMVNPLSGRETEYDLSKTPTPKKIFIAGGGVSGCESAIAAATRGHNVTLFEASPQLGGQWIAASVPPDKEEFLSFAIWQHNKMKSLGVTIRMNLPLTPEIVKKEQPDVVIIATGSTPIKPRIDGIETANVTTAIDVLLGNVPVGQHVAVIGGGLAGAETALQLAVKGADVCIIEQLPVIAKDGEPNPNHFLLQHLEDNHVCVRTSTKVVKIAQDTIIAEHNGQEVTLSGIDTIVLAVGVRSNHTLADELKDYEGQVIITGDASQAKNGYANIQESFEIGLNI